MLPIQPQDWDDKDGWEAYYREYCAEERWRSWVEPQDLAWPYVSQLAEKSFGKIWFPGCGASLAPRLYAALGFEVWASDISERAADFQRWLMEQSLVELGISSLLSALTQEEIDPDPASYQVLPHDFRQPFVEGDFDVVLNFLSFQGLSAESARQAATSHFAALRPGGWAIFVMGNLSRTKRPPLEEAIASAGFYIPYYEAEKRYREALTESQIPYRFISQRPSVRQDEEPYRSDKEARASAQKTLQEIELRYNAEMRQADPEIAQKLEDNETKVALLVYAQ